MSENKKIVVGIGKGVDGVVSAYLLKKQGFEVHLVSVNMNEAKYLLSKKDKLGTTEEFSFSLDSNCAGASINRLKKVAEAINASYSYVDKLESFKESVIGNTAASSFSMIKKSPCYDCQKLLFSGLKEVADRINSKYISTGHYAKVQKNLTNGSISILSGNDQENDQSHLLSSLPDEVLKMLLLPLGELQAKEIIKISDRKNFNQFKSTQKASAYCFNDARFSEFVDCSFPNSLKKSGSIIRQEDGFTLCQHEGGHHFNLGDDVSGKLKLAPSGSTAVGYSGSTGKIIVTDKTRLTGIPIFLKLTYLKKFRDFSFKQSAYARFETIGEGSNVKEFLEVRISVKVAKHIKLEFVEKPDFYPRPGMAVTIFEKSNEKNKLLLASGTVCVDTIAGFALEDLDNDQGKEESGANSVNF